MYEIILLTPPEHTKKQQLLYAVVNSRDEVLCKFRNLHLAADFIRYLSGADLFDDSGKFLLSKEIYEYNKLTKSQLTAEEKGVQP